MFQQLPNISRKHISAVKIFMLLAILGIMATLNLTSQEYIIATFTWTVDKISFTEQNSRSKLKLEFTKENETFRENLLILVDKNRTDPSYIESDDIKIIPASARVTAKKIFHHKPLVLWATEMHMSPMKDLANTLAPFGVKVLDYSLDISRCGWHDCSRAKKLKVISNPEVTYVLHYL